MRAECKIKTVGVATRIQGHAGGLGKKPQDDRERFLSMFGVEPGKASSHRGTTE